MVLGGDEHRGPGGDDAAGRRQADEPPTVQGGAVRGGVRPPRAGPGGGGGAPGRWASGRWASTVGRPVAGPPRRWPSGRCRTPGTAHPSRPPRGRRAGRRVRPSLGRADAPPMVPVPLLHPTGPSPGVPVGSRWSPLRATRAPPGGSRGERAHHAVRDHSPCSDGGHRRSGVDGGLRPARGGLRLRVRGGGRARRGHLRLPEHLPLRPLGSDAAARRLPHPRPAGPAGLPGGGHRPDRPGHRGAGPPQPPGGDHGQAGRHRRRPLRRPAAPLRGGGLDGRGAAGHRRRSPDPRAAGPTRPSRPCGCCGPTPGRRGPPSTGGSSRSPTPTRSPSRCAPAGCPSTSAGTARRRPSGPAGWATGSSPWAWSRRRCGCGSTRCGPPPRPPTATPTPSSCRSAGSSPPAPPESVAEAEALGADRLVVSTSITDDLGAVHDELSAFAELMGLRHGVGAGVTDPGDRAADEEALRALSTVVRPGRRRPGRPGLRRAVHRRRRAGGGRRPRRQPARWRSTGGPTGWPSVPGLLGRYEWTLHQLADHASRSGRRRTATRPPPRRRAVRRPPRHPGRRRRRHGRHGRAPTSSGTCTTSTIPPGGRGVADRPPDPRARVGGGAPGGPGGVSAPGHRPGRRRARRSGRRAG